MDLPTVLIVDDRADNLRVLELILEPLDITVITASSGQGALRMLLEHDVAVIVLDVRMPGMDGFETAAFVKQRERTKHVPIIFLTALGNDREQALSGYEAGAVDFIEKPVEPIVLRAKVTTFAKLHLARMEVARQAELLQLAAARDSARELAEMREVGEKRFRDLAEAMPSMVFSLDTEGQVSYRNERWEQYTGRDNGEGAGEQIGHNWDLVHPADAYACRADWQNAIADPASLSGGRLTLQLRLRRHDGAWLWHDVSCQPQRDAAGTVIGWVGTATEVDGHRRTELGQRTLAEAGAVLVESNEIESAIAKVAELAVPTMVDWCAVDMIEAGEDERPHRLALRVDGSMARDEVHVLLTLLAATGPESPIGRLQAEPNRGRLLLDEEGADVVDDVGSATAVIIPLLSRGELIGAVTVGIAAEGRPLGMPELSFVRGLATRLSGAIDNARLYQRAQDRAQAAEVLETIADGVVLVDLDDVVQLWNPAAAAITGVHASEIVGRRVHEVISDWRTLTDRLPVDSADPDHRTHVTTAPVTAPGGEEVWLSISAVAFERGIAYAFRDLTAERAVDRMKSDFIATVSHELRTPLASIYGAAVTLQRVDVELDDDIRNQLLDVIGQESQQLAAIVEEVLTASRLDAGFIVDSSGPIDVAPVMQDVIDAAHTRAGEQHTILLSTCDDQVRVAADRGHLRRVLENLVENAIKYSPEGGVVRLSMDADDSHVRWEIQDEGLGIAPAEQRHIFEKFYRVDADMNRGIGGTGLGLFIVRELVRRMSGRIDVESSAGGGSTFVVTLPRTTDGAADGPTDGSAT